MAYVQARWSPPSSGTPARTRSGTQVRDPRVDEPADLELVVALDDPVVRVVGRAAAVEVTPQVLELLDRGCGVAGGDQRLDVLEQAAHRVGKPPALESLR